MSAASSGHIGETTPPTSAVREEGVRREVGYIPAIEGLRGIAVLWVVAFHYVTVRSGRFADPFIEWIDGVMPLKIIVHNGFLGVDLFFLITGFLLTLPWFKHALEGRPRPSTVEFYARRARRILPAYYVQLALLFFVFLPLLNPSLWSDERKLVLGNVGLHAAFLHYTTPFSSASLSINGALWTLALEMQYYLLLPLIALAFLRAPVIAAVAFLTAAVLWKVLSMHDLEPLISLYARIGARWNPSAAELRHLAGTQFPAYLGHFSLGILCGRAWLRNSARAARGESAILALIALAALLILYAVLSGRAPWSGEFAWMLILASMAAVMWAVVSRRPSWSDIFLGARPLAFVGRISYSMYLYHLPALLLFNRYTSPVLGGLAFPAYFGAVLLVSTLSFHFVERPFMRMPVRARPAPTAEASPDDTRRSGVTS